jgi:hypothetical protein
MEVEQKMKEEFGVDILVTDENLLSKDKSPFQTLGTLTEHLGVLLKESDTEK